MLLRTVHYSVKYMMCNIPFVSSLPMLLLDTVVLHCVTLCNMFFICVQSASALARTGKGRSTEEKKKDEE